MESNDADAQKYLAALTGRPDTARDGSPLGD
jgi:hypothetical protein